MMKEATKEKQWVLCPWCGAKTRLQIFQETDESIIDVKNFIIKTKQPDAKTQC